MRNLKFISVIAFTIALSGCLKEPRLAAAYWQRVDGDSALYMTGPKSQQILDENISSCVVEIEELVKLNAVRGTTPPDTHNEYHSALKASGDLDYFDTPRRYGAMKVAHSDYYDFESCMRSKGWERVNYVQYDVELNAQKNYKKTQYFRKTGRIVEPEDMELDQKAETMKYFEYNEQ